MDRFCVKTNESYFLDDAIVVVVVVVLANVNYHFQRFQSCSTLAEDRINEWFTVVHVQSVDCCIVGGYAVRARLSTTS